jgi:diacylglycerol kinase (ATP)
MKEGIQQDTPADAAKRTKAILIANPKAGSYAGSAQQIEETIAYLRSQGWDAELRLTEVAGDVRKLAHEAVERKADIVVAVGGDGTINEVIQELAGSETALGVLPNGTVNVWARETGIPLDNVAAREVLTGGRMRRIDLGRVGNHYFLLMATLGFDAEVTSTIETKPVKRFGVLGYVLIGLWLGLGYPNFHVSMQMGKRTRRAHVLQVVIGNTQLYAGAIRFTWQAKCDDGVLDICIVRSLNLRGRLDVLIDFLLRRKRRERWVRYETADAVDIRTNVPVAIQADGEPVGYTSKRKATPTRVALIPGALKVIVPQEVREELFSRPPLPR